MSFDYVNTHYGVNACIGRRVMAYGFAGTITKDFGHYIGIVLDTAPHAAAERYHPTDGIEYGEFIEYAPPKLTGRQAAAKRNYDEYLDADYGHSFAEWLGINMPEFEYFNGKIRMLRRCWNYSTDVAGEWRETHKAAKASYKEALKKRREVMRDEQ